MDALDHQDHELARRALMRGLTVLFAVSAPSLYWMLAHEHRDWSRLKVGFVTFMVIVFARAILDFGLRKFLPRGSTPWEFDDEGARLRARTERRRYWFWRYWFRVLGWYSILCEIASFKGHHSFMHEFTTIAPHLLTAFAHPAALLQAVQVVGLFAVNFLIFMGPMLAMNISQIKGFEPGDVNLGVEFEDVRGQKEAKEEIRRVIAVWEDSERFRELGGKPDRGMLFLGAPGVGKTMIAKAVATSFNAPFVFIPGSGFAAAQPLDAKILTPAGWTTMGEILVGDTVINPEGGTARVLGIFPQGVRDSYRVTFNDGSSAECDIEHLWQVRNHSGWRGWQVRKLGEIRDLMSCSLGRVARSVFIPLTRAMDFQQEELPLDPYLLGALLGDGGFGGHISFTNMDEHVVEFVRQALPSEVMLRQESRPGQYTIIQRSQTGRGTPYPSNRLKIILHELGLMDTKCATKFIPERYLFGSVRDRLALLRGLMDTDGSADDVHFGSTSLSLAQGVVTLVRSLGGTATLTISCERSYFNQKYREWREARDYHNVYIKLPPGINPFKTSTKANIYSRTKMPTRRIVDISLIGPKEVQCIKLDSENELYITDDFIVTHNTFIGIDAIVVRYMYRKAKKLARKWGGQCIVFIDEIDAVARSRSGMIGGGQAMGMGGMFGGGMGQMALNQLLVVMDSIESPPWLRRTLVSRFNLLLDAMFFIPQRIWRIKLRLPIPKPRKDEQVYFLGATNVALEALDQALTRAGRMGRHIYFRNPTKLDRKDILDLYVARVSHDPDLDTEVRRDELARITDGVSPASIEQICSMALINAQNDGRSQFRFKDFLEAMTTLQAGTAVGIEYTEGETLAVALHEAGHAAASHIYCPHIESSRLSIRMRGSSLGHHMALEKEERFGRWRAEDFGEMIRGVAAMATEYVFYGENGRGVSGDLSQCSALARLMTNHVGMVPYFTDIPDPEVMRIPGQEQKSVPRSESEKIREKFAFIGKRLLTPAPEGQADKSKDLFAAEFLGHAFVTAWNFVMMNKDKIQQIADVLTEEKEIFGNDVVQLLDAQDLEKFEHLELASFMAYDAWPYL